MDITKVQVMLYSKIICDLYPRKRLSLSKWIKHCFRCGDLFTFHEVRDFRYSKWVFVVSSAGSFMNWKYPTVTTKQPIRRINRSILVKRRTITAAVDNNLYYLYLRIENLHLIQKFINLSVILIILALLTVQYLDYHIRHYIVFMCVCVCVEFD